MIVTITPHRLSGTIAAIPSKSHVHRLLICAALGDRPAVLPCRVVSQDIEATVRCLKALGAGIAVDGGAVAVTPLDRNAGGAVELDPGESGSTYRFMTPLAAALGRTARFTLHGKLPSRPMDDLWNEMEQHGAVITGKGTSHPVVEGQLTAGRYRLPGTVSSQFFTGLLFALPLLEGSSRVIIADRLESAGYIDMTLAALAAFGIAVGRSDGGFSVPGAQRYAAPARLKAEGDWSNAAFWLCAGAAGAELAVMGLALPSLQGDSAVTEFLRRMGAEVSINGDSIAAAPAELRETCIDMGGTPDLVPALAVAAAAVKGRTVLANVGRLRLKESDRVASVCGALNALGGHAAPDGNSILIDGYGSLQGGIVDACGDHRIAMLGAAASVLCSKAVTITGAEAVNKSYPGFFGDFAALGGIVRTEA